MRLDLLFAIVRSDSLFVVLLASACDAYYYGTSEAMMDGRPVLAKPADNEEPKKQPHTGSATKLSACTA